MMNTDRVTCKNPNCERTILPTTAKENNGLCMPCVQKKKREEYAEYIKNNRRDVNAFEGMDDLVEVLKIVHSGRKFDPLINWIPYPVETSEVYQKLSTADLKGLTEYCSSLVGTEKNDEAIEIARCLGAFTSANLNALIDKLIENEELHPSVVFAGCDPHQTDKLIQALEKNDWLLCSRALSALAWVGNERVVQLFAGFRKEPPTWANELNIPPEEYSRGAGWELTNTDERRNLFYEDCFELEIGRSANPTQFVGITERKDTCPSCRLILTNLLEFEPKGFGQSDAPIGRIEIVTCERCVTITTVFGSIDKTGKATVLKPEDGYEPESVADWVPLPREVLQIGKKRSPIFASDQFLPVSFSQIGGHPTWVQDEAYPKCPSCFQRMKFVAQIDNEDIEKYSEGIFYVFLCTDCSKSATSYQQT